MKRQRLSLAAVATFAFLASWAVPCVCVAQTWGYSEAQGQEICDPLSPESYAVFADGSVEKIVDGANLSQRVVASLMICNTRVENVDFSGSTILRGSFDQAVLVRCNFSGTFLRGAFCDNYTKFVDCVFDDALLDGFNCDALSAKQLKKTRNFKRPSSLAEAISGKFPPERLYMRLNDVRCANLDFSFAHLRGSYLDLTARQLRQTLDFHYKIYRELRVGVSGAPLLDYRDFDFSRSSFVECQFVDLDFTGADFTDAAFHECSLSGRGLTLEQMKSTWNWKARRMDLLSLPPELQAQVDAALAKEAAQAPEAEASPETAPATEAK